MAITELSTIKAMNMDSPLSQDDMYAAFGNIEILAKVDAKINNEGSIFLTCRRQDYISIFEKSNHLNISSQLYLFTSNL